MGGDDGLDVVGAGTVQREELGIALGEGKEQEADQRWRLGNTRDRKTRRE